jgi:diguanylate cyclase (GGDEF)-like protein/PAS domain S-box-containing protein
VAVSVRLKNQSKKPPSDFIPATLGRDMTAANLAYLLKASQVISSENLLPELLKKLMTIFLECSGAKNGALILKNGSVLQIEVWGTSSGKPKNKIIIESKTLGLSGDKIPVTIIETVSRKQKSVILDQPDGKKSRFAKDPYFSQHKPGSVLCFPLLGRGALTGILFLENEKVSGCFAPQCVETLKILTGLVAVSLQNARLHNDLDLLVQERTSQLMTANANLQQEIIDLKNAGDTLRGNQEKYFTIIEEQTDMITRWSPDTTMNFVNNAYCSYFGVSREKLIGHKFINLLPRETQKIILHSAERLMAKEADSITELERNLSPEGDERWVIWVYSPVYNAKGEFVEIQSVGRDITERKRAEEAEREQRQLAEALRDSGAAINSSLNLDEILDQILITLERVVQHDTAIVMLVDDQGIAYVARQRGYEKRKLPLENLMNIRLPVSETPNLNWMVTNALPLIIKDTQTYEGWVPIKEQMWIRSFLGAPIKIKDKVVGFINLDSSVSAFFTEIHAERLMSFTNQVAIALENARLYADAQLSIMEQSVLNEISRSISTDLDLDGFLEKVYQQVNRFMNAKNFGVSHFEPERNEWTIIFVRDEIDEAIELLDQKFNPNQGSTGYILQTRQPLLLNNPEDFESFTRKTGMKILFTEPKSWMGVPLITADKVVGVMTVQSYERSNFFTKEDFRFLTTIGSQIAAAFENVFLFARMEELATKDELTGLNNRRHFFELAQIEYGRAFRYHKILGAIMFDIDHFKKVNDSYGHNIGDQALRVVGALCLQLMRNIDIIGRYGGDEFAIILPETNLKGVHLAAERIRKMINLSPINEGQDEFYLSVSLGVAIQDENVKSLEALLDRADRALYDAKLGGRNQVKIFTDQVMIP